MAYLPKRRSIGYSGCHIYIVRIEYFQHLMIPSPFHPYDAPFTRLSRSAGYLCGNWQHALLWGLFQMIPCASDLGYVSTLTWKYGISWHHVGILRTCRLASFCAATCFGCLRTGANIHVSILATAIPLLIHTCLTVEVYGKSIGFQDWRWLTRARACQRLTISFISKVMVIPLNFPLEILRQILDRRYLALAKKAAPADIASVYSGQVMMREVEEKKVIIMEFADAVLDSLRFNISMMPKSHEQVKFATQLLRSIEELAQRTVDAFDATSLENKDDLFMKLEKLLQCYDSKCMLYPDFKELCDIASNIIGGHPASYWSGKHNEKTLMGKSYTVADIVLRSIQFDKVVDPANLHDNSAVAEKTREANAKDMFMASERCESVDFFISYKWKDNPRAKSRKLIMWYFGQKFEASVLLSSIIVGIFFAPLSVVALQAWWIAPATCIALGFITICWFRLNLLVPWVARRFAPWKGTTDFFWLDKCCINQNAGNDEIANYSKNFSHIQSKCGGMIVFFSNQYVRSLWCTYELMNWCHMHKNDSDFTKNLIILNLQWAGYLNPLSWGLSDELAPSEVWLIEDFSVAKARCGKPSDRMFIIREIRAKWGSIEKFEAFVHSKLPEILQEAKHYHNRAASRIAKETAAFLFS